MKVYDRVTKEYGEEKEFQEKALKFLYGTVFGRILLKLIFSRPWYSKLQARYQNSPKSQKDIRPFIKEYQIDMTGYDMADFRTFNDFFTRKRPYATDTKDGELMAVCDGKLCVYSMKDVLCIKNVKYTLGELLGEENCFSSGRCLVFRLAVNDYHRYVYPDEGTICKHYKIKGALHTVRPISSKYKVFSRNYREVTIMETKHFGKVIQVEVGAMLVGKIVNHRTEGSFRKLEEKGYFEYGGSTIILLMERDIAIDEDILEQSLKGIETQVHIGERIGRMLP